MTRTSRTAPFIQATGAVQLVRVKIGSVLLQVAEGLVEDLLCPLGLDETNLRDPDEQVSQAVWVQDVSVVDDDKCHVSASPSPG